MLGRTHGLALALAGLLLACEERPGARSPPPEPAAAPAPSAAARLALGDGEGAAAAFAKAAEVAPSEPWGGIGAMALAMGRGDIAAARRALGALQAAGRDPERRAPWLVAAVRGDLQASPPAAPPREVAGPPPAGRPDAGPPASPGLAPPPGPPLTPAEQRLQALARAGQWEPLIRAVDAESSPSPVLLRLRARALQALERWEDAVRAWRRALAVSPGDILAVQSLAETLMRLKRPDEALAFYRVLLEREPTRADIWRLAGDAQAAKGAHEAALKAYRAAVALGIRDPALEATIAELQRAAPR